MHGLSPLMRTGISVSLKLNHYRKKMMVCATKTKEIADGEKLQRLSEERRAGVESRT